MYTYIFFSPCLMLDEAGRLINKYVMVVPPEYWAGRVTQLCDARRIRGMPRSTHQESSGQQAVSAMDMCEHTATDAVIKINRRG